MEEDTPVEIEAKVDGLVTSYELIELGGASSITVEDLNDVTEGWLELVSGMGGLSEQQIEHIRSHCVLSFQSTTTKKRAASSSTTSYAGMAGRGGSSNANSRGRSQKRSKQTPSTPATKKKASRSSGQKSNDNGSDGEKDDDDSDEDDFEPKGKPKLPSPSQSQDEEEQESPPRDAAADRAAEAARLRLEQQKMLMQQPKSPNGQSKDSESDQESDQESEQESEQESDQESDDILSTRPKSKRPTPMDLAWRQVAIDEKEGRIPEFVAETETEKRMEEMSKRAQREGAELRRIRQLNRDGNEDAYLDALGEYLNRHKKNGNDNEQAQQVEQESPSNQQPHQKQQALVESPMGTMSGNTGSQDDIIQEEGDDEAMEMEKEDDRGTKLKKAREYLSEMRVRRDNYRNRRGSERYDSPYLLVRLPSLMNQTKKIIDNGFEEGDHQLPLGETVRLLIDEYVDLYDLGMKSAISFLDTEDKAWIPVTFSSLASLANDLEMSTTPAIEENTRYRDVKRAVEYARDTKLIDLPSGQSIKYLAKICLTMNEPTRNQLFVLVHLAAGCSIFSAIKITDLTVGKHPILSREVLQILEYSEKSMPEDSDDLLRRYKAIFDDRAITYSAKTKLMDSFLRIRLEILNLDDEHWQEVDRSGSDKMAKAPTSRFFNILSRQNNAMIALTMVVASSYLHDHVRLQVDHGNLLTGKGVDELLYRNSMASVSLSVGTKILMPKTYNGTASSEYMYSIYSGFSELLNKARTGGRGRERSIHGDDISILFDLDNDDVDDHNDLLEIFSGWGEESDDNDDMEVEEGV